MALSSIASKQRLTFCENYTETHALRVDSPFESVVAQFFYRNPAPLIGRMHSANSQFDVVIGQRFSRTAIVLTQRDCLQVVTNKLSAKRSILLSPKFAQDSIPFTRNP